jgi:hypothetical protein
MGRRAYLEVGQISPILGTSKHAHMLSALPRRTPNAERQTPNAKRQTPNAKRQTPNAKRQTPLRSNDPSHDFLLRGPCKNISADSGFSFFRLAKPG